MFNRFENKASSTSTPLVNGATEEEPAATPTPTATPTPKPVVFPTPPSNNKTNSQVKIQVDTQLGDQKSTAEILIYPGATGSGKLYRTADSGDKVYDWYKSEMERRSYQIRNNVRAKANDVFKGILQGVKENQTLKVTIEQANAAAETQIILE